MPLASPNAILWLKTKGLCRMSAGPEGLHPPELVSGTQILAAIQDYNRRKQTVARLDSEFTRAQAEIQANCVQFTQDPETRREILGGAIPTSRINSLLLPTSAEQLRALTYLLFRAACENQSRADKKRLNSALWHEEIPSRPVIEITNDSNELYAIYPANQGNVRLEKPIHYIRGVLSRRITLANELYVAVDTVEYRVIPLIYEPRSESHLEPQVYIEVQKIT